MYPFLRKKRFAKKEKDARSRTLFADLAAKMSPSLRKWKMLAINSDGKSNIVVDMMLMKQVSAEVDDHMKVRRLEAM